MKRFLKYLTFAVIAVIALSSCNEEKKKRALLPHISGKAGEVVIADKEKNTISHRFRAIQALKDKLK